jgi:hypothetical protein
MTQQAQAVIDGVDLDAVAAAVRGCPAIDDLSPGPWGGVVSYLPGRQVAGLRVASDHVLISVRGRWGVPVAEMARQVRTAVAGLVGTRRVDLDVADLAGVPGEAPAGVPDEAPAGVPGEAPAGVPGEAPAGGPRDEVSSWPTSSPGSGPGVSSSAPITPTVAVTPLRSPLASPPMTGAPRGSHPPEW